MNEKEPHPKNTITDNEMNIGGNFHQGNNQIFLGKLPEMLTLSSDPIKFSKTDRIAEIIKNINRMASEELAKELTIHILNHIRKSKKKSLVQSIAFEEDLLEWINIIFYDHNEGFNSSLWS